MEPIFSFFFCFVGVFFKVVFKYLYMLHDLQPVISNISPFLLSTRKHEKHTEFPFCVYGQSDLVLLLLLNSTLND